MYILCVYVCVGVYKLYVYIYCEFSIAACFSRFGDAAPVGRVNTVDTRNKPRHRVPFVINSLPLTPYWRQAPETWAPAGHDGN